MAAAHAFNSLEKNKMAAGFYKKMYRKNNVFRIFSFQRFDILVARLEITKASFKLCTHHNNDIQR
jgi:hypothetical protein